jgi:hypothetical protein
VEEKSLGTIASFQFRFNFPAKDVRASFFVVDALEFLFGGDRVSLSKSMMPFSIRVTKPTAPQPMLGV